MQAFFCAGEHLLVQRREFLQAEVVLGHEPRRRVTVNTDGENIDYFKAEAARTDVPYQVIINMYLMEFRMQKRHLAVA